MSTEEKYAEKIAAALRIVEDPKASEGEVEAALAAAQRLMTKYSIDEAMIRSARSITESEKVVTEDILYHSVYSRALYFIGRNLALHNDCKILVTRGNSLMKTTLHLVGFESDVHRVQMLNSSMRIQCDIALGRFWANYEGKDMLKTEREKFKVRREFIFSFARGMNEKLENAQRAGIQDAVNEYGDNSVALVLRSKEDIIEIGLDELYPNRVAGKRSKGFAFGGWAARIAGHEAGLNSDVGQAPIENNPQRLTA